MEANERPGPALAHDEFLVDDEFLADILCGFDDHDEAETHQPSVERPDAQAQERPVIAYVPPVPDAALDPGTQPAAAVTSLRPSLAVRVAWRALAHRRGARRAVVAALASAAGLAATVATATDDQPRSRSGPTGAPPSRSSLAGAGAKPSPTAADDRPSRAASPRQRPSASRRKRRAAGNPSARPASRRATPTPPVERRGRTRQQPSSPPTITPRDGLDDRPVDAPPARLPAPRASGEFTAPATTPPSPVDGEFAREFTP